MASLVLGKLNYTLPTMTNTRLGGGKAAIQEPIFSSRAADIWVGMDGTIYVPALKDDVVDADMIKDGPKTAAKSTSASQRRRMRQTSSTQSSIRVGHPE